MSFIATLSRRISLQLVGGVTVLALSKPKSITWGNFGPRPAGRWDIWDARNFFNAWMHGWWRPTKPWWCVELSTWWGSPRVGQPGNPWAEIYGAYKLKAYYKYLWEWVCLGFSVFNYQESLPWCCGGDGMTHFFVNLNWCCGSWKRSWPTLAHSHILIYLHIIYISVIYI